MNRLGVKHEGMELSERNCPHCNGKRLYTWPVAESPDDYHWAYSCMDCDYYEVI